MCAVLGILILFMTVQGQGPPRLPRALAQDEVLRAGAVRQLVDPVPARRLEAFQAIAQRLAGQPPEEQVAFLLDCGQRRLVPASVLKPAWDRLAGEWPGARTHLRALLSAGAEGGAELGGVLQAVSLLSWPSEELPGVVEEVARHLDDGATVDHAREALLALTGHDFRNWAAFNAWWSAGASALPPVAWWQDAATQRRRELLELWTLRLRGGGEEDMLAALQSQVFEVRRLALEALGSRFPEKPAPEALARGREALRDALQQERDPILRRMILELVPRFFEGDAARTVLDAALKAQTEEERLAAARALQVVRPPASALASLVAALGDLYGGAEARPAGSPGLRMALFASLEAVTRQHEEAAAAMAGPLGALVSRALDAERDSRVRRGVYEAAARLDGQEFLHRLIGYAGDEHRAIDDRAGALAALRGISLAGESRGSVLELLHGLLDHPSPDLRYNALLGLQKLKDPRSAPLLGERLGREEEANLVNEILKGLRDMPDGQGLEALLAQPAPATPQGRTLYLTALVDQVGTDLGRLRVALAGLRAHGDSSIAFQLLDGFPREAVTEEQQAWFVKAYTRGLAGWLLETGLGNGRTVRAEDAVQRLRALRKDEPDELDWPRLEASLLDLLGRPAEALPAWRRVLELTPEGEGRWPVALRAAAAALACGERQSGLDALASLAGDPPEDLHARVAELRSELEALPAPVSPGPPPKAEPEPEPAPAPPAEGGEGGPDPAETKTGDGGRAA